MVVPSEARLLSREARRALPGEGLLKPINCLLKPINCPYGFAMYAVSCTEPRLLFQKTSTSICRTPWIGVSLTTRL